MKLQQKKETLKCDRNTIIITNIAIIIKMIIEITTKKDMQKKDHQHYHHH